MTYICGKWLKYLGKWLRYKRLKYVANDLIWEIKIFKMASMCGGQLKYLRNGFYMLEMT